MYNNEYEENRQRHLKWFMRFNLDRLGRSLIVLWLCVILVIIIMFMASYSVAIRSISSFAITQANAAEITCDEIIQDEPLPAEQVIRAQGYKYPSGALMPAPSPMRRGYSQQQGYGPWQRTYNPYRNNCGEECYREFHDTGRRGGGLRLYPNGQWGPAWR